MVVEVRELLFAVLVLLVEEPVVTLFDEESVAVVVAAVAAEPEGPVDVLVQDTAVGRLVTAFALQRFRAYCVAAC